MRRTLWPLLGLLVLLPLLALPGGANAREATPPSDPIISKARVIVRSHGEVIWRSRWYGANAMDKGIHVTPADLTGGTMTPASGDSGTYPPPGYGNPEKVTIRNIGRSSLGTVIWQWDIYTKWSWVTGQLMHYVTIDSAGHAFDTNGAWSYDGVKAKNTGFYQYVGGFNKSGWKHYEKAGFHGPALGGTGTYTRYVYPENWLYSHSDGGFWWKYACC